MSTHLIVDAHPQNKKYQARIKQILNYAEGLAKEGRPILHSTLLKYTLVEMMVGERTAKSYVKAVLIIMEDRK